MGKLIIIALGSLIIALKLTALGFAVYGVVLAFSASVLVGFLSLIVAPAYLIYGLVMFFANIDLPAKLAAFLAN